MKCYEDKKGEGKTLKTPPDLLKKHSKVEPRHSSKVT